MKLSLMMLMITPLSFLCFFNLDAFNLSLRLSPSQCFSSLEFSRTALSYLSQLHLFELTLHCAPTKKSIAPAFISLSYHHISIKRYVLFLFFLHYITVKL